MGKKIFIHIQKRIKQVKENKLSAVIKDYNKLLFNFGNDIFYKSGKYKCLGIELSGKLLILNGSTDKKTLAIEESSDIIQNFL